MIVEWAFWVFHLWKIRWDRVTHIEPIFWNSGVALRGVSWGRLYLSLCGAPQCVFSFLQPVSLPTHSYCASEFHPVSCPLISGGNGAWWSQESFDNLLRILDTQHLRCEYFIWSFFITGFILVSEYTAWVFFFWAFMALFLSSPLEFLVINFLVLRSHLHLDSYILQNVLCTRHSLSLHSHV